MKIYFGKLDCKSHVARHLRKPRVLSPVRSLRMCVRNEVDIVPLACEDGGQIAGEKSCY